MSERSRHQRDKLDLLISGLALTALLLTPWAYGSVEAWSLMLFELGAALLLFLWALKFIWRPTVNIYLPMPFWIGAGFILIALIQLMPGLANTETRRISIAPHATWLALLKLLALLIYFFVFIQLAAHIRERAKLINLAIIVGVALAVFGIVQHLTSNNRIYWWRVVHSDAFFGPFVNHNHFAGYMEMTVALALGLVTAPAMPVARRLWYSLAAILMAGAAALSLSRGGFIGLLVAAMVVAVLRYLLRAVNLDRTGKGLLMRFKLLPMIALLLAITGITGWLIHLVGAESVQSRLATMSDINSVNNEFASRREIWRAGWLLFKQYPVMGVGLGAYPYISGLTLQQPIFNNSSIQQTHNDYLQILTDTGLVGGLLALLFLATLLLAISKQFREVSKNGIEEGLVGACGGIAALLVHSAVDFNLQLASNALLFLALVALAAQSPRILPRAAVR